MAPVAENGLFDDLRISFTAQYSAAISRDSQNPNLIQISSFLLGPPFPDAIWFDGIYVRVDSTRGRTTLAAALRSRGGSATASALLLASRCPAGPTRPDGDGVLSFEARVCDESIKVDRPGFFRSKFALKSARGQRRFAP